MPTSTYKTKCKVCESPVYYYPVKLLIEGKEFGLEHNDNNDRMVSCTCTGEKGGTKHTLEYTFPTEFEKL